MIRRALERGALWMRDHPRVTGAVGSGAAIAAGYYGGPIAKAGAEKALPYLCDVLRLCA